MYKTLLYVCCGLFGIFKFSYCKYPYKEFFFKQKVDHFGFFNDDYFSQRYLLNTDHWNPKDGAIFLYTGNEGDIEMFTNNAGFMWEIAPRFHALLIFIEHRYYGQSMPYGPDSLSKAKFRGYLTSEQALADYATLIYHLKETMPGAKNCPVIAFGGSYGGMLAAWIRMKYPYLIAGAIASSAPICQFIDLVPCSKFTQIATHDFARASSQCPHVIQRSWSVLREYASTQEGAAWIERTFKLCTPFRPEDINELIGWLTSTWIFMATTDYPYPTNFLVPLPGNPVNVACAYLNNPNIPNDQLIVSIVNGISVFHNHTGQTACFNLSEPAGKTLGADAWDYQACTEMVMPMCQNGKTDMFEPSSWNFPMYSLRCSTRWGVKPDLYKAIISYGGNNIKAASNIVFSNGDLDPWLSGGIVQSVSDTVIAIKIHGAAHHMDIRASHPLDPTSVIMARQLELHWIANWTQRDQN